MPTDPTPTDVYAEAATAMCVSFRPGSRAAADAAAYAETTWFRAAVEAAYARGIAEGRRQATEGWERQWGFKHADDSQPEPCGRCEGVLQGTLAAGRAPDSDTFSRLVGPWETAEHPEPAPSSGQGGWSEQKVAGLAALMNLAAEQSEGSDR